MIETLTLFLETPVPAEHDEHGQILLVGIDHGRARLVAISDEGRLIDVDPAKIDLLWRYNYDRKTWVWVGDEAEPEEK